MSPALRRCRAVIVRRIAVRALLLAGLALVLCASPAFGRGFAPPAPVSDPEVTVRDPRAAIAPDGRTAVLWFERDAVPPPGQPARPSRLVARIGAGPEVEQLGAKQEVIAAREPSGMRVVASPDGTFAACWEKTGANVAATGFACATAPPGAGFGPPRDGPADAILTGPVVDGAGRLVVGLTRLSGSRRTSRRVRARFSWAVVGPDGAVGPEQPLGTTDAVRAPSLGVGPSGEVVAGWTERGGRRLRLRRVVLRVLGAGGAAFGPRVDATPRSGRFTLGRLFGGPGVGAIFRSPTVAFSGRSYAALRVEGGRFGTVASLVPRGRGYTELWAVLPDAPDRATLIFNESRSAGTDCGDLLRATVNAASLTPRGPGGTQQLSARGQLAVFPGGAVLADGTVVAVWQNHTSGEGMQLEYALRPPGAARFDRGVPLPENMEGERTLAAGGGHAVLAWTVAGGPDDQFGDPTTRLVVSTLRAEGPFAAPAPRPRNPGSGCE